ncbi:hypothetical protein [Neisseria sicca]|uniref:hypothetical protein n=1 Tax=Neisseria sicca TaxID=490 RepID=UPI0011BD1D07|nr:hypothetical protein [Neisseria sicca]
MEVHGDEEGVKGDMEVEVVMSGDKDAGKVFVRGEFDWKESLNVVLMDPSKKWEEESVKVGGVSGEGEKGGMEYEGSLKGVGGRKEWYVGVEES